MTCSPVAVMTRKAGTTKSKVTGESNPTPPRWTAWCPTCGDSGAPLFIGLHAEAKANQWCAEHRMKETA